MMKTRLLRPLTIIAAVILGIVAFGSAHSHVQAFLTVVSWGGAYTKSQMLAYVIPFREQTDTRVTVEEYNGGLRQIRKQVESYNTQWDVVDLELADVHRGCEDGLLEKIDHSILLPSPEGMPPEQDFIEGTLHECGVGTVLWSTVIGYKTDTYKNNPPQTLADFFDTRKYPGPRGLRRTPRVNLEWALLADGVPADQVYPMLGTPEGVNRAFTMLDRIKGNIVWWQDGAQPPKMLEAGDVVMTSAYNGRLYHAIAQNDKNFAIVWDRQIWDMDLWAIPKHSLNKDTALDFIKFSTAPERLAAQAEIIAYGPARKSAMAYVPDEVKPHLPTAFPNMKTALRLDADWWAANQARLNERFEAWLAEPVTTPEELAH